MVETKRVYTLVRSFKLADSPFIVKMQGSRENMLELNIVPLCKQS